MKLRWISGWSAAVTATHTAIAASVTSHPYSRSLQGKESSTISTSANVSQPLAYECLVSNAVCLSNGGYPSVLPAGFHREAPNGDIGPKPYGDTIVPGDNSWLLVSSAEFLVFDETRAADVLGSSPTIEFMFQVGPDIHEAPVFIPGLNTLLFSRLSQSVEQYRVDLNTTPPRLSTFTADPPLYVPNGAFYHSGQIYYAMAGSNATVAGGPQQRPGIAVLDPNTLKSTRLLNNYYGYAFNGVDDVTVDSTTGFIWFTTPYYSWWLNTSDIPPQMRASVFRFDPASGSVVVVADDLYTPNGIAFAPDRQRLYISDTEASGMSDTIDPNLSTRGIGGILYNTTGRRTIYRYDVVDGGRAIVNKRPIHYDVLGTVPDGLKVARNGYVVTATGNGLTVMDEYGDVIVRVQTNFTVNNFQWSDWDDWREVWMVGQGGVGRLRWNLQGQVAV